MPRILGYRIAAFGLILTAFGVTASVRTSAAPADAAPATAAASTVESRVSAAVDTAPVVVPGAAPAARPTAKREVAKPLPRVAVTPPAVSIIRRVGADDYPWSQATTNAHDTWGFTQRQCVSYVAWRLATVGRAISNAGNRWGSALHWDEAADGRSSNRPAVGAVAHWNAGESSKAFVGSRAGRFTAGGYGHVGYVTSVYPDGSVEVAQYNLRGDRRFSSMRMTAPRYLLLG